MKATRDTGGGRRGAGGEGVLRSSVDTQIGLTVFVPPARGVSLLSAHFYKGH